MKRFAAILLAALLVMGMSTVALAADPSPATGTIEGSTGGDVSTSVVMQETIKTAVAAVTGADPEAIVNYATAKMSVGSYSEPVYTVKLNMPASLNGQTVKIAVLTEDGTYKIIEAEVVNGQVVFDAPVVGGNVTFMVYREA